MTSSEIPPERRGGGKVRCKECRHIFPHFKVWCGHADHYGHEGWEDAEVLPDQKNSDERDSEVHIFTTRELLEARRRWATGSAG